MFISPCIRPQACAAGGTGSAGTKATYLGFSNSFSNIFFTPFKLTSMYVYFEAVTRTDRRHHLRDVLEFWHDRQRPAYSLRASSVIFGCAAGKGPIAMPSVQKVRQFRCSKARSYSGRWTVLYLESVAFPWEDSIAQTAPFPRISVLLLQVLNPTVVSSRNPGKSIIWF